MRDSTVAESSPLTSLTGDRATGVISSDVAGRRGVWDSRTVRRVLPLARAQAAELHGPLSDVRRRSLRPAYAGGLRRAAWAVHGPLCIRGVCRMAALERTAARRRDHPRGHTRRAGVLGRIRCPDPAADRDRASRAARGWLVGPALRRSARARLPPAARAR